MSIINYEVLMSNFITESLGCLLKALVSGGCAPKPLLWIQMSRPTFRNDEYPRIWSSNAELHNCAESLGGLFEALASGGCAPRPLLGSEFICKVPHSGTISILNYGILIPNFITESLGCLFEALVSGGCAPRPLHFFSNKIYHVIMSSKTYHL